MNTSCTNRTRPWPLAGALVVLSAVCATPSSEVRAAMMPDFSLPDVNATSSTYGQLVSPRDYLQQVSGWYFGNASS